MLGRLQPGGGMWIHLGLLLLVASVWARFDEEKMFGEGSGLVDEINDDEDNDEVMTGFTSPTTGQAQVSDDLIWFMESHRRLNGKKMEEINETLPANSVSVADNENGFFQVGSKSIDLQKRPETQVYIEADIIHEHRESIAKKKRFKQQRKKYATKNPSLVHSERVNEINRFYDFDKSAFIHRPKKHYISKKMDSVTMITDHQHPLDGNQFKDHSAHSKFSPVPSPQTGFNELPLGSSNRFWQHSYSDPNKDTHTRGNGAKEHGSRNSAPFSVITDKHSSARLVSHRLDKSRPSSPHSIEAYASIPAMTQINQNRHKVEGSNALGDNMREYGSFENSDKYSVDTAQRGGYLEADDYTENASNNGVFTNTVKKTTPNKQYKFSDSTSYEHGHKDNNNNLPNARTNSVKTETDPSMNDIRVAYDEFVFGDIRNEISASQLDDHVSSVDQHLQAADEIPQCLRECRQSMQSLVISERPVARYVDTHSQLDLACHVTTGRHISALIGWRFGADQDGCNEPVVVEAAETHHGGGGGGVEDWSGEEVRETRPHCLRTGFASERVSANQTLIESRLRLESVDLSHSGRYTCLVRVECCENDPTTQRHLVSSKSVVVHVFDTRGHHSWTSRLTVSVAMITCTVVGLAAAALLLKGCVRRKVARRLSGSSFGGSSCSSGSVVGGYEVVRVCSEDAIFLGDAADGTVVKGQRQGRTQSGCFGRADSGGRGGVGNKTAVGNVTRTMAPSIYPNLLDSISMDYEVPLSADDQQAKVLS